MTDMGRLATLTMRGVSLSLLCVCTAVAAPALAQESGEGIDPLQALTACRDIADPTARLACFDREFAVFTQARDDKKIAVVDREEVRETKRALFGLNLPRIKLFERDQANDEPESFTGTIRSVSAQRGGRFTIQIDESVWQTTETGYFQTPPKVGEPATVTKGILGSFRLSVDGKSGLKAVRVR